MKDILLSIVVPIYNVSCYLEKCIYSIVKQTYPNIEIILVDDGSTDNSGNICDKFSELDSRISVIHKENGGLVSARKAGALIATGKYILPIDGDDWVEEDYCEKHVKVIKTEHPDIVWDLNFYKDYEHHVEETIVPNLSQSEWYDLVIGNHGYDNTTEYSLCKKCYRRSIYLFAQQSVADSIVYAEDVACVLRLLSLTNNIFFFNYSGYHYVQRSTSILHNKSHRSINDFRILVKDTSSFLDNYGKCYIDNLKQIITVQAGRGMMLYSFGELQKVKTGYLVPFKSVIEGSKIIVFGAGLIGQQIIAYINASLKYNLVRWIDSNVANSINIENNICQVDDIRNDEYDFVIIATTKKVYQNQMIQILMEMDISMKKIVTVDDAELINIYKNVL